jgi:hypothetical protein
MLSKRGECEFEIGGELRRWLKTIALLVQAGGRHFDKGLTLDEVFDWIDNVDDIADVMGEIAPAMEEGMPGGKKSHKDRMERKEAATKSESDVAAINSLTTKAS